MKTLKQRQVSSVVTVQL